MKIIFMGSALFSVPSLTSILESGHQLSCVVAQPDKPAGRGQKITACPVAQFARERGLSLFQPNKLSEIRAELVEINPDLIVVVAFGKFLPDWLLNLPSHGCINAHASLLPLYRGAAPINWAIVNGDDFTGVTIIKIDERMDAGDVLTWSKTDIDSCETAPMLYERLSLIAADLLIQTMNKIEKGKISSTKQDESLVTFAPKLMKEDGLINWNNSSKKNYDLIRGMLPWPVAHTYLDGKMIKIFEAAPSDELVSDEPGTIINSDGQLCVACKKGRLYILELQIEGGRRMSTTEFLKGHRIEKGKVLGQGGFEV